MEGRTQTAQRAEVRALARVLQRATRAVTVISDSSNTVRIMRQIKQGKPFARAHSDFWRFIETRQHLVGDIRWIRSHQSRETALANGFTTQDWEGNTAADKLATQGIAAYGDGIQANQKWQHQCQLVKKAQSWLVQRALACSETPWYQQQQYQVDRENMRRDIHPGRHKEGQEWSGSGQREVPHVSLSPNHIRSVS